MNKDRIFRLPSFVDNSGDALLLNGGSRRVSPVAVAAVLFGGLFGYTSGDVFEDRHQVNVESAYKEQFIDNNGCLASTPFDPEYGATVVPREVKGSTTITVIPQSPESYTPAVLNLQYGADNKLTFSGNITGGFLAEACDFTGGY